MLVAAVLSTLVIGGLVGAGIWAATKPEPGPSRPVTEVFLEPADDVGDDAFTDDATLATVTIDQSGAPTLEGEHTVEQVDGATPGLYGGTGGSSTCDREAIAAFLADNPDKAQAWAAVHQISTADIASFLSTLTPVALTADTRVRNHGFRDGRATERDAVLQAGTAVLVDDRGVPRVRCSCGNPLLPAQPSPNATVRFRGDAWDGFDTATVQAPVAAHDPIDALVVRDGSDPSGDTVFDRPTGTDGTKDSEPRPAGSEGESGADDPRPIAESDTISPLGLGPVRLGMTFDEAREATASELIAEDYLEDSGDVETAACVSLEFVDSAPVWGMGSSGIVDMIGLETDSPIRTAEGIGLGSSIEDARAAYAGRVREEPNPYSPADPVLIVSDPEIPDRYLRLETGDGSVNAVAATTDVFLDAYEGCA